MNDIGFEVVGYIAAVLTTIAFLPQLVRVVRRRSAEDISYWSFTILSTGIACWLAYGFVQSDAPLIIANGITLCIALAILILKWVYGRPTRVQKGRGPDGPR